MENGAVPLTMARLQPHVVEKVEALGERVDFHGQRAESLTNELEAIQRWFNNTLYPQGTNFNDPYAPVFVNNCHNVSDALVHLNGTFWHHNNIAAQMHCNQQVTNNDQHNINDQVETRIHHLETGREDYRTRPPQLRGQLHEHADGKTY